MNDTKLSAYNFPIELLRSVFPVSPYTAETKTAGDDDSQAGDDEMVEKDPYFDALNLWVSTSLIIM